MKLSFIFIDDTEYARSRGLIACRFGRLGPCPFGEAKAASEASKFVERD